MSATGLSLMTVKQAADQLQISESCVYALIENGKLACHRIGIGRGTIRISDLDLENYLQSCRHCEFVKVNPPRRRKLRHVRL